MFQSVFIPVLAYRMDTMTVTTPQLGRLDAYYYRFLRRNGGVKASHNSRVTNLAAWEEAGTRLPDFFGNSSITS